jgi:hypothetical protein
MLTLVRDTFPGSGEIDDLLTPGRFTCRAEVEGYLLDRVLPAAYEPHLGALPTPYGLDQADRWLGYLATEMNRRNTRDLAWWHIHEWAPATHRVLIMALPAALGAGVALGAVYGLTFGLSPGAVAGLVCGLLNGVAVGLTVGLRNRRGSPVAGGLAGGLASAVTAGIAFGIAIGQARGVAAGITIGLAAALGLGLASMTAASIVEARRHAGPRRLRSPRWRTVLSRGSLTAGLAFGLAIGLALGLAFGLTGGLTTGLIGGLGSGLAAVFVLGIINGLVQSAADATSPMDPITCWRRDRQSGLTEGIAYGLACGVAFGLAGQLVSGTATGLTVGVIAALGEGLAVTIAVSQSWLATTAFLLYGNAGILPRHGIRFLEDARNRGVLRTVGSVYQFRHARLQDQLATTYTRHSTAR